MAAPSQAASLPRPSARRSRDAWDYVADQFSASPQINAEGVDQRIEVLVCMSCDTSDTVVPFRASNIWFILFDVWTSSTSVDGNE